MAKQHERAVVAAVADVAAAVAATGTMCLSPRMLNGPLFEGEACEQIDESCR